jgi:hypothetical protein
LLLIPMDRAASWYQLVDFSLAVFFPDRRFTIPNLLSFAVGALVPSALDNLLLPSLAPGDTDNRALSSKCQMIIFGLLAGRRQSGYPFHRVGISAHPAGSSMVTLPVRLSL